MPFTTSCPNLIRPLIRQSISMKRLWFLSAILLSLAACDPGEEACSECEDEITPFDNSTEVIDSETESFHFIHDVPSKGDAGGVNVVIEIPSGTNLKYEVSKESGEMELEEIDGESREIHYLPYPSNYGFVPQTLLSSESGGDGDPLDVLVLGPAIEQGEVVECKLIGVLKLLDSGEQDDKLIAAPLDSEFANYNSLPALDVDYNGISTIIETWFTNYKGPGEMVSQGYADTEEAESILREARLGYTMGSFDGEELKSDIELR